MFVKENKNSSEAFPAGLSVSEIDGSAAYTVMPNTDGRVTDSSLTAENTQSLRFLLAAFILIGHASAVFGFAFPIHTLNLAVCMFFFLSGYGLYESLKTKKGYLKNFVQRRYPSILIPYYIIYAITPVLTGIFLYSIADIPQGILDRLLRFPLQWYVTELLVFYTIFFIVFLLVCGRNAENGGGGQALSRGPVHAQCVDRSDRSVYRRSFYSGSPVQ